MVQPGIAPAAIQAREARPFVGLFNNRNLTGFRIGDRPLDGLRASPDGRFEVRPRGVLRINPGQGIQELSRSRQDNRNFTLVLEFRASTGADSGVFLRGVQLQVRDYPRAGPYTNLTRFRDGGFNTLRITVRSDSAGGAVAFATCNGEVLESALRVPATGSIGFQAESGLFEYRRIRIRFDR